MSKSKLAREGLLLKTVQISARSAAGEAALVSATGSLYQAIGARSIWKKEPDLARAMQRIAALVKGSLVHYGRHRVTGDAVWTLTRGAGPVLVFIGDRMQVMARERLDVVKVIEPAPTTYKVSTRVTVVDAVEDQAPAPAGSRVDTLAKVAAEHLARHLPRCRLVPGRGKRTGPDQHWFRAFGPDYSLDVFVSEVRA